MPKGIVYSQNKNKKLNNNLKSCLLFRFVTELTDIHLYISIFTNLERNLPTIYYLFLFYNTFFIIYYKILIKIQVSFVTVR